MSKELRKKARRQRRVQEVADKMSAGLKEDGACQDLDQDFLNAWLLCFANELVWTMDRMKGPGIMHQVLRRKN